MQFDTTVNPLQINVVLSEEDGHLEILVVSGTLLPVSPEQVIPIPIGIYRVPLGSKKTATSLVEQLQKAIDEMPDDQPKSDLIIPSNTDQANAIASQLSALKHAQ